MVSHLYEFLSVLSDCYVVKKTLDKEYNWMVSHLYEFLYVLSELKGVHKTLDKEYNWTIFLLYEFLSEHWALMNSWRIFHTVGTRNVSFLYEFFDVLSDFHVVQKTLNKEYK